jgi:hypothetical protein
METDPACPFVTTFCSAVSRPDQRHQLTTDAPLAPLGALIDLRPRKPACVTRPTSASKSLTFRREPPIYVKSVCVLRDPFHARTPVIPTLRLSVSEGSAEPDQACYPFLAAQLRCPHDKRDEAAKAARA